MRYRQLLGCWRRIRHATGHTEQLDTLGDIDDGHVEAECLARHVGNIAGIVRDVENGENEMEDGGPAVGANAGRRARSAMVEGIRRRWYSHEHPALELEIVDSLVPLDDIVVRVRDQAHKTGETDNGEGLDREDGKDHCGQGGRQKNLVNAVSSVGAMVQVEQVCCG